MFVFFPEFILPLCRCYHLSFLLFFLPSLYPYLCPLSTMLSCVLTSILLYLQLLAYFVPSSYVFVYEILLIS